MHIVTDDGLNFSGFSAVGQLHANLRQLRLRLGRKSAQGTESDIERRLGPCVWRPSHLHMASDGCARAWMCETLRGAQELRSEEL